MLIGDTHVLSNVKFDDRCCYGNCYYGNIAMAMVTIAMLIGDMHVLSNVKFDNSRCCGNCYYSYNYHSYNGYHSNVDYDMHVLSNMKFDDSCCYGNCHHGKCCLVIS